MFASVGVGTRGTVQVLVVGAFKGKGLDRGTRALDTDKSIASAAGRGEFTGEVGSIAEAFPVKGGSAAVPARVILVGLGDKDSFKEGALRNVAASVARRLSVTGEERVAVEIPEAIRSIRRLDMRVAGRCFGEGLGLCAWNPDAMKGTANEPPKRGKVLARSSDKTFHAGLQRGVGLAESANIARDMVNTPPNVATPMWMAQQARSIARKTGMTCRVLKGDQLEKERMEGLINVGKASENEPCLIRLEYKPARVRKGTRPVVLVGKTITFDTGGLSLKPAASMAGMKTDKGGGCAVLGAMHAIATVVKPNRPVVALLAAAENCISDEAYRPDDVLTFRNGVTVEITNTDAEGRLVLADALCYACDVEKPEFIVDMATLTGGVVVALGNTYAGYFSHDATLQEELEAAGETSGERVWRLPLNDEYRAMMKSSVADIVNGNPNRRAHPVQGAAFLSYFVKKDVPWAHIDIAGVATADGGDGSPFVKGATGFGVRLMADLLSDT